MQEAESIGPGDFTPKSRVSKLLVGRVYNLGNYENLRVDVTVDIAEGDDAGRVFHTVENILTDLQAKDTVDVYKAQRAKRLLATPSDQLTDADRALIPEMRRILASVDEGKKKREGARAALSTLSYTQEHKDAKDSWDSRDDDYGDDRY